MRLFTIAALFLLSFSLQSVIAKAEVADRIVAVVNNEIITLSELNEEGKPYFQALIKQVPTEQLQHEMQKLRQEVLSHLIDQRLIEQQATKLEIKISDDEITQTIETMLSENHATKDELNKDLAAKGLTEEQYRKQLKSQILQSRLINHEVRSKVVITDEKINQYYKEKYVDQQGITSGYHLLQIGFLWDDQGKKKTVDEARIAAESAKKRLDAGENFGDVARSVSDLPSKEDGGDIGIFQENELAAYMKDAVLAMKPGETSGIIETPAGLQILKLLSQSGDQSSAPPLMEVKKDIENQLYKQEGEQLFKKWITELRANAFIKQNL